VRYCVLTLNDPTPSVLLYRSYTTGVQHHTAMRRCNPGGRGRKSLRDHGPEQFADSPPSYPCAQNAITVFLSKDVASPHRFGLKFSPSTPRRCLSDDYPSVRAAALKLACRIGSDFADVELYRGHECAPDGLFGKARLCDNAFMQACSLVFDADTSVRVAACSQLGRIPGVSPQYLLQTLTKKMLTANQVQNSQPQKDRKPKTQSDRKPEPQNSTP
jgi:hypothetical protein